MAPPFFIWRLVFRFDGVEVWANWLAFKCICYITAAWASSRGLVYVD